MFGINDNIPLLLKEITTRNKENQLDGIITKSQQYKKQIQIKK